MNISWKPYSSDMSILIAVFPNKPGELPNPIPKDAIVFRGMGHVLDKKHLEYAEHAIMRVRHPGMCPREYYGKIRDGSFVPDGAR